MCTEEFLDTLTSPAILAERAFGRYVDGDGVVHPARDTGFRMSKPSPSGVSRSQLPVTYSHLDTDQFHNSEVTVLEPALNAVNFVTVNREAAERRNVGYIRENIANRIEHENSVKQNIAALQ